MTQPKPDYRRGDVVLVLYPDSNLQSATPEGQQSGLLTDSVIMTDNLATITNSAIFRVIGSLPMSKVDKALSYTLGL